MRDLDRTVAAQGRVILMVVGVLSGAGAVYAIGEKLGWW